MGTDSVRRVRRSSFAGMGCALQLVALLGFCLAGPVAYAADPAYLLFVGLLAGALFLHGHARATSWSCSRCASRLGSAAGVVCPYCGARFSAEAVSSGSDRAQSPVTE